VAQSERGNLGAVENQDGVAQPLRVDGQDLKRDIQTVVDLASRLAAGDQRLAFLVEPKLRISSVSQRRNWEVTDRLRHHRRQEARPKSNFW